MRRTRLILTALVVMAAMLAVCAGPAMAADNNFVRFNDDDNDFNSFGFFSNNGGFFDSDLDQESESGDIENNFEVSNTGDFAFQCTPAIQFGNTGNFNNGSTFVQGFGSELDDFEPEGIDVSFEPVQNTDCSNTIQQSSAASSSWDSWW